VGLQNDPGDTVDGPQVWINDGGDLVRLDVRLENGLVGTVGAPSMEVYGGGELVGLGGGLENVPMGGPVSATHFLALAHQLFPSPFFVVTELPVADVDATDVSISVLALSAFLDFAFF